MPDDNADVVLPSTITAVHSRTDEVVVRAVYDVIGDIDLAVLRDFVDQTRNLPATSTVTVRLNDVVELQAVYRSVEHVDAPLPGPSSDQPDRS